MFQNLIKVFPKKLPSTSQVLKNLNNARELLSKFDECIKRRTTLSPHQIGSWEQSDIKGAFKIDVIPFPENLKETFKLFEKGFIVEVKEMKDIYEQMEDDVDQCSVAKKCFKIEKKQILLNNDRLLEENIVSDIMCTYLRSLNEVDNQSFEINDLKVIPKVVEKNDLSKSVTLHLTTNKIIEKCTKVLALAIMGYGDLQMGNILILHVYYVEGLGHNLFFVEKFCDLDLEVAFRKHTCFVQNLEGVDLLSGSRGSNLYTILMADMMKSSPIYLLSKASKTKSWLWHR
ncbi:hypothetical protein Tco_0231901 [Tanacetum coccineum]